MNLRILEDLAKTHATKQHLHLEDVSDALFSVIYSGFSDV
jgi:hypothetical protein